MGRPISEAALNELQLETKELINEIVYEERQFWSQLTESVRDAWDSVQNKRMTLIEKRVRDLETESYPVLWETVIEVLMTLFPAGKLIDGLAKRFQQTFKIGRMLSAGKPKAFSKTVAAKLARDNAVKRTFRQGVAEYNGAVADAFSQYKKLDTREVEDTFRNLARDAAKALAQPLVTRDAMESKKAAPKPIDSDFTAVGFRGSMVKWLNTCLHVEERFLEDTKDYVHHTRDGEAIKSLKMALEQDRDEKIAPFDFKRFQLFLEACIWCTTWDFTPTFVPKEFPTIERDDVTIHLPEIPAHLELPPLGDDFWPYAVGTYLDPYWEDGVTKFKDIPPIDYLGPSDEVEQVYLGETPAEQIAWRQNIEAPKAQFTPKERLAFQWGCLLAPQIVKANGDLGEFLSRYVGSHPRLSP